MKIHITYAAAKNPGGGWIPWVANGLVRITPPWAATGMSQANALIAAMKLADDEAARYVGDRDVVVEAASEASQ